MRRIAVIALATGCLVAGAGRAAASAAEMAEISSRVHATLVAEALPADEVESLRAGLGADGTWPDVDYADTAVTGWSPSIHLRRLRDLASGWAATGGGDSALLAATLKAYDAWISRDPTSPNWWHNQIYAPQRIGETMLLLGSQLSSGQRAAGLAIVARAYVPRSTNSGTNTGANRIDRAYPGILRGLISGDEPLLRESFLAIGDTILVTTAEGVQPDFSYQQHGAQLHILGYGVVYARGVLRYGGWAAGTSFGYQPIQQRVLVDFLLDGVQWFVRGDTADATAAGRGLTRAGQPATAAAFLGPVVDAISVGGGYRLAELEVFADRLGVDVAAATADPATALTGHRHFWRSDSTTWHRPGLSVFLKTSSTRTRQPESGNGEGLKNLHLADGVTLIQRDGDEYDDLMPLWDWRALPGTTTEQRPYSLKPAADWGVTGTSPHAGGVSDGRAGATAFAYSRLGVAAKKSWFFLGDRMVALGTGIEAPAATGPVWTSVNQCHRDGPVTYSAGGGSATVLAADREAVANLEWVHHDGIGYYFPSGSGPATLAAEPRTGSWASINESQSADPVAGEVFALHLDHGQPVAGGGYAYVVTSVDDAAAMDAGAPDGLVIERNDPTAQAVRDSSSGVTAVNFWAAGSVAGITASHPCSVLVRREGETLAVAVSDPTQSLGGGLTLEIDQAVAGMLHADTGITIESEEPRLRLRAAMGGTQGRSLRARFFLRPHAYQRIVLPAVADGFVFDREPDSAFGSGEVAVAKLINSPNWNRLAYFRFDLSGLPAPPVSASLRLRTVLAQGPGLHAVQVLPQTGWSESSLTWNTRPEPLGPPLSPWLPAVGQAVGVDVPAVGDSVLDLAIIPLTRTGDGLTHYATRENPEPALRPALEVIVARPEIEIWRLGHFGGDAADPAIAGDLADPDGDGLANAIEFVLGTSPMSDSSGLRPELRFEGEHGLFAFRRSQASGDEEVFVEASADLRSWSRLEHGVDGVSIFVSPVPGETGVDLVEFLLPVALPDAGRRFLRLGVAR